MSDMLTQEQIEALMAGVADTGADGAVPPVDDFAISPEEADILGEVGNMCMGASATTMYSVLGRKVQITTPNVTVYPNVVSMLEEYNVPFIVVEVEYTEGVRGRNLLLLKTKDAALITDLMLGGDGNIDLENIELNELHLSAISEIMNQMVASGATSMSQILGVPVNISPPSATMVDLAINDANIWAGDNEKVIKISFAMEIEGLLESELMQIMPYSFGKELVDVLLVTQEDGGGVVAQDEDAHQLFSDPSVFAPTAAQQQPNVDVSAYSQEAPPPAPAYAQSTPPPPPQPQQYADPAAYAAQGAPPQQPYADPAYAQQPQYQQPPYPGQPYPAQPYPGQPYPGQPYPGQPYPGQPYPGQMQVQQPVNVRPVQYQSFDVPDPFSGPNIPDNLDMIIDLPLQVAVELGKTRRSIRDVLDFNVGSVVVLEKLAGELVEVVVNGKLIAKGEVVVIDENYGVRITEILAPNKRL